MHGVVQVILINFDIVLQLKGDDCTLLNHVLKVINYEKYEESPAQHTWQMIPMTRFALLAVAHFQISFALGNI